MVFPFVPKSTVSLRFGDYWAIQREDAKFGFLVYLKSDGRGRSGYFAAVLDHIQSDQVLLPHGPCFNIRRDGVINQIGLLHVKTFKETSSQILGNVEKRLPLEVIKKEYELHKTTIKVWGYRTSIKLVNEVDRSQS